MERAPDPTDPQQVEAGGAPEDQDAEPTKTAEQIAQDDEGRDQAER